MIFCFIVLKITIIVIVIIIITRMPFIRRQPSTCFDLVDCYDLDPLTFISYVDLDMIVTYLHAKNLINRSRSSKVMVG